MMKELMIKIFSHKDEIHISVGGNDYYYNKSITEEEAIIRSMFKYCGYNPDYYLDGAEF